ncbi:endopeptidase La [bacterium]|nr:endopeptidase La [bacterium]
MADNENVFPEILPLFPVRDAVLFPFSSQSVSVGGDGAARAVRAAQEVGNFVIFVAQRWSEAIDRINEGTIYSVGMVALITKSQTKIHGKESIHVQGLKKAKIKSIAYDENRNVFFGQIEVIEEDTSFDENLCKSMFREVDQLLEALKESLTPQFFNAYRAIKDPARLAEFLMNTFSKSVQLSQKVLEENAPLAKLESALAVLRKEVMASQLQHMIRHKTMETLSKDQKEAFLREEMKVIQKELGAEDPYNAEIAEYEKKLESDFLPEQAAVEARKQIDRLKTMHPANQESIVVRTWLDTVFSLPWKDSTEDNKDINRAEKVLEEDHYGLEDVKERILEFLAVRQINGDQTSKSPILCFVGPPGVGKTSLGRSIARALGRKFHRLSLGGLHDEAEIRGHRRTYVGAMQGKILEGLKICKSNNPVFMLDEIDKLGKDFRGDPSSALLEVLDPEQNFSFLDNYIGIPFDLSRVFFIATANWEDSIPEPLKDRMEVIRLSGYTDLERVQIAKQYLIPRQLENNGLPKKSLQFTTDALNFISRRYTREAGVRNLERCIGSVCRKVVTLKVKGEEYPKKITQTVVEKLLKLPPFSESELEKNENIGVVTGLAWTQFGGATLRIESNWMLGKGNLILTGQLGDIMKESARIALSYIQSNAEKFGLGKDFVLENKDIHIHFPAGATPKDGPSAGITITTSLLSLFLGRKVDPRIAMTGEISLTGDVLPIGGLKEKLLAAKRNGVVKVFMPEANRSLYESISAEIRAGIEPVFVKSYAEIFKSLFS